MPNVGGYNTPTERAQARLSGPAHARQGMPASVPGLPQGPSDGKGVNQLLQAVRAGQMPASQLMQLLSLIAGGRGRGGARRANATRQRGRQGPRQAAARQAMAQRQGQRNAQRNPIAGAISGGA